MKTQILEINDRSLGLAAELINRGELVAFPTETVYGLGANALCGEAVRSIYAVKGRPSDNPLIVHVTPDFDIEKLVDIKYEYAKELRRAFCPGPLTMVYDSKGVVAGEVSCGLSTVAVRVPSHAGAQRFLNAVGVPVAAPSANISKHVSPVTAAHVYDDLAGKIPLILDGGRCSGGIESTVLDVTGEIPVILRSGLITFEMIKSVAGACRYSTNKSDEPARSPGMKYKHYSPRCETVFFGREDVAGAIEKYKSALNRGKNPIFICDGFIAERLGDMRKISLGSSSLEYAANVYEALREAETQSDYIIGIGVKGDSEVDVGVMNRLTKACAEDEK